MASVDISVVVPSARRTKCLLRLLGELEKQSNRSFEVIVVSDGCDKTIEALSSSRFLRLSKVLSTGCKGFGVMIARNVGAMHAKGKLLIFLDDDVIPTSTTFLDCYLNHYSPNVLLIGKIDCVDSKSGEMISPDKRNGFGDSFNEKGNLGVYFWTGNCAVDRASFYSVGGFDMSMYGEGGSDTDFGSRHYAAHSSIKFVKDARVLHSGLPSDCTGTYRRDLQQKRLASGFYSKNHSNIIAYRDEAMFNFFRLAYSTLDFNSLDIKSLASTYSSLNMPMDYYRLKNGK